MKVHENMSSQRRSACKGSRRKVLGSLNRLNRTELFSDSSYILWKSYFVSRSNCSGLIQRNGQRSHVHFESIPLAI